MSNMKRLALAQAESNEGLLDEANELELRFAEADALDMALAQHFEAMGLSAIRDRARQMPLYYQE